MRVGFTNACKYVTWSILCLAALAISADGAWANELAWLSDEFSDANTIANWQRRYETESPAVDGLERWEIDGVDAPGAMLMMPHTVTWYQGYRGPLAYKNVTGDFAITTHVDVDNRQGTGMPTSAFSLAGIMIRTAPVIRNAPENYVFLSLGYGAENHPSTPGPGPHFEVKTTENGNSVLHLSPAETLSVDLQIARVGDTVVTLYRRPSEDWTVHRVYERDDFPETLQVGLVAYTDWDKVATYTPEYHNSTVLDPPIAGDPSSNPGLPFRPDLIAEFDYARFFRPSVPDGIDPATASDAELLSFLGSAASWPYVPGDANFDGAVNRLDAAALAANFGVAGGATWQMGDFDGDAAVTLADLALWQANVDASAVTLAAASHVAVPEPGGVALVVVAAVVLSGAAKSRGRACRLRRCGART